MSNVNAPAPSASGTLERTPIPSLLAYAFEQRLTGTLELRAASGSATIVFAEGWPTKARTSEPAYLGGILLGLGLIDDAQLNASLARMASERKLHGRILLEMGALTPPMLQRGLVAQLARKIEQVATMPAQTTYAYYAGVDALAGFGGAEPVRVDPLRLIWTAARNTPPWQQVAEAMARVERGVTIQVPPGAPVERLGLEGRELELCDLLRRRPTPMRDLLAAQILTPHTTRLLVYVLMITKLVSLAAEAPEAARKPSVPPMPPPSSRAPAAGPVSVQPRAGSSPGLRQPSSPDLRLQTAYDVPRAAPSEIRRPTPLGVPAAIPPRETQPPAAPASVPSPAPPAQQIRRPSSPAVRFSAPPPSVALTPELAQLRQSIIDRVAALAEQTHFEVLELPNDASPAAVQRKFISLAKTWHPDRLAPQLFDVRDLAEKLFARMTEAHGVLTDPDKRAAYVAELSRGGGRPRESAAPVVENAAVEFQKAEVFLKKRAFGHAEEHARRAHEADPSNADYLALLVWVQLQKAEGSEIPADVLNKHLETLDRAIKLNERCERAYFARATIYKRMNKPERAIVDFKQAADLNPHNVDAAREVRLWHMRHQPKKTK
jgi:hypothetical protein